MAGNPHLLEQVTTPENLLLAWRSIRGNIPKYRRVRSSGPDGISLAEFERDLPMQLRALREMLLKRRYRPQPPARFTLPKKGGGVRQVSVLTVRDRVAQRAAQQVIEPLWEEEFLDCSFGFRPGLSTEQAILCVQELRRHGYRWVVDGDIMACFDSLNHDLLVTRLRRKIADGRVLELLQAWLDSGVMQAGPPAEGSAPLTQTWLSTTKLFHQGIEWAANTVAEQDDPYTAARYEGLEGYQNPDRVDQGYDIPTTRDALLPGIRKQAFQRALASSLLWGASMAKPAIAIASKATRTTLASPAGRRLLQRGVLVSGGLAGVAAGAAVAAYLVNRKISPAPCGVLQGSPLSPLLANIYLHPFDISLTHNGFRLVRFADDWVICCPSREEAEAAYNAALRALAALKLKVNSEKTRLLGPGDKLEWLGAVIR